MTKLVQQSCSSSATDQQPLPEVSEQCGDDQGQLPQASSTPAKGLTTPTVKRQQHQPPSNRRTSTRLTSIRNDSLSSSSSSLSSTADLESGPDIKSSPSGDVFKVPSATPGMPGEEQSESGIICRLPLDRLQAILGALNILKSPPDSESGISSSPSPSPTYKLLCLYCDRTFTSQTLMAKHIDRVHRIPKDRRSSSRVVPTVNDGAFPSCSYCNKGKVLNPASEDLTQLFKHLIDQHSDRYFACETCALRFPSEESRDSHIDALHQPAASSSENRTRPKSKAALKSFNLNKTKKCEIVTTPLTIQVDFDTEAIKNLTIENIEAVDSLSAALGIAAGSAANASSRLRSSGRTSARSASAAAGSAKTKVFKKSDKMLMRSSEPTLSRLGIAQHRTPRQSRRVASAKNRRKPTTDSASCSSSISGTSSSQPDNHYNKITKLKTIRSTLNNPTGSSETDFVVSRGKNDIVSTYDEDFYENVNLNVRQNLSCHLDGKIEASTPNAPSPLSPVAAVPAIRSTVVKSPLQPESKIHEATNLPAITVFPTLLTVEQFGTDLMPLSKMKKPITKNSWKWKWDFVKKYKYVNENGKIVKKVKQPTLGLRDLSKLDMWTQLTMRTKHELIRNRRHIGEPHSCLSEVGDTLRQEQRKQVNELNQILDSRLLPQINLEQHDQSIIKIESEPSEESGEYSDPYNENLASNSIDEHFIASLQLLKVPDSSRIKQVVLSGEWARPRCYICYCCGDKFNSLKQMEEHKTFRHPYVYSTYYEIVGRELIEKQLFKHFFIPLSALTMHRIHFTRLSSYPGYDRRFISTRQLSSESTATITEIKSEDSSSNEATSFSTTTSSSSVLSISANTFSSSGSSTSSRSALDLLVSAGNEYTTSFTSYPVNQTPVRCSKCNKECVNTLVLYAHILNCTNDYIWLQAKKRMKYRRANRRRKGYNRAALAARKAQLSASSQSAVEKSETASNHSGADVESSSGSSATSENKKKTKSSPPRPKENDSDIVRRLTANLPAKRVSRQILQVTKQIRKRPQTNIVKGKKQVISTLAPSKAGVPRGANVVALKLRSGKIAAIPSSNKKVQIKPKSKPKNTIKEEGKEATSEENIEVVDDIKEEKNDDTKEENEEQDKESKQHMQEANKKKAHLMKKKVILPRGRILPVRSNTFGNRAMHWKGKKVLPFRKGLNGNSRTLRSGVVKILPTVGMRKVKAKSVTPTKKEMPEKDDRQQENDSNSPVHTKKNCSKKKEGTNPVELESSNLTKDDAEKQIAPEDTTDKTQMLSQHKDKEKESLVSIRCEDDIQNNTNRNDDFVTDEVPKESSQSGHSDEVEEKSSDENATEVGNITTSVKEIILITSETATKSVPQETADQSIVAQPVTPVKSPSLNSQPPSAPATPLCTSSQQANKRKPKKLNDCIAMLTGKLSEKLGVDFFNQAIGKNTGPKNSIPSVETRASKQILVPATNMVPIQPPTITTMPLQITPPQLAPLPLVMNSRRSSVSSQPPMLSPVSPIVAPMEEISDEPLNLSKNSPIGRSAPPRTRDMYNTHRTTHMSPPPPPSPTALHSPHQLSSSMRLPSPQPQTVPIQQQQIQHHPQHLLSLQQPQPGPSTPNRNLPSIKLPPGLIIERVEYKSRPVISKEAPSVTIVARRQPPPSIESRAATHLHTPEQQPPPSPQPVTRRQSVNHHQQQQKQQQQQQQQLYGDPRKISPPSHQRQPQQQQLSPPKQIQPPQQQQQQQQQQQTPSIASTLRQERPLENRISVTITEAKNDRHLSPSAKQPPVTLNIPERMPIMDRTSSSLSTHLIIPTVPNPSHQQSTPSNSKRSRRKSVYVSQAPVASETQSSSSTQQIPPVAPQVPVVPPTFLPGPFPLFPHSLLAGPPLGLDLQRLAVGLPPHLKPPAIPPLSVPAPHAPSTAAAAALLEKIFQPARDVIVKQIESAAAAAAAAAATQSPPSQISPLKNTSEVEIPIIESSSKVKNTEEVSTLPSIEKKSRSRARNNKTTKAQSVVVPNLPPTPNTNSTKEISTEQHPSDETSKEETPVESFPTPVEALTVQETVTDPIEVYEPAKEKTPPMDEGPPKSPDELTSSEGVRTKHLEELKCSVLEHESLEPSIPSTTPTPALHSSAKTVRKRRKNELAAILSDQLLESFKEVDQNALQDLKMMHDMSCEKPDIKFSLEQIPQLAKRKVNIRHPDLLAPATRQSPVSSGKKVPAKKGTKDQMPKDQTAEDLMEKDKAEELDEKKDNDEREKEDIVQEGSAQIIEPEEKPIESKVEDVQRPATSKKNVKKTPEKTFKKDDSDLSQPTETESDNQKNSASPAKPLPNRRTRKLSIDIERIATLERKGRQNLKATYSKQLEGLDIAEKFRESSADKKSKSKILKKTDAVHIPESKGFQETEDIVQKIEMPPQAAVQKEQISLISGVANSKPKLHQKSRSKTPFPFPKEKCSEKSDLERLKDALNIETPSKKPTLEKKKQETPKEDMAIEPAKDDVSTHDLPSKKLAKRKGVKVDKEEDLVESNRVSPNKKKKEEAENAILKNDSDSSMEVLSKSNTKKSKTSAPIEEKSLLPMVTPRKVVTPSPPKRIMARRSSVFVDRNLAQYLEERDAEQELLSNSSFKDDLILTSRRGTRSQGTVDLDLVQSFAEAAMKPRDPRRRSAAAVAAAAASAKRAEEERRVADEERKRREKEDRLRWEEEKRKYEEEEERKKKAAGTTKPAPVLRRISARRASLFIAPPPEVEVPKVEENIAEIGKASKRQYRRRASVYQPMSFLDEEELKEKQEEELKSKTPMRSKTPGPGGTWDQDMKTVGRRRNQSSVFNGTPEPTIESLLEPLTLPTGTKRRTKNSQLAENLSKLFNIEEEIQLIDQSKRKPRKTNTPIAVESPSGEIITSTPVKATNIDSTELKVSPIAVESKKIDELVKVVEKEVANASSAPKPRESLSFSNDDEDETPKLNKLVEDIINKSESESDSDDDNMSLACFLKPNQQNTHDSLEGNVEDGSNSAMDDDISVTTEVTTFGGSIRKRKRRKSICVTKSRRPKPPVDENKPAPTFNCELCKKVFKKQDAYNKHRMTLSHIAKLSEQEYLEAQQKEREAAASAALAIQQSNPAHATPPSTGASPQSTIKNLSQEEKLFYECCSMLKESNADNENLNLTVSLKSDEIASSGMMCDPTDIPSTKAGAAFPNSFTGLTEADKNSDNCFNMGDSFPSFPDVHESENYIQTINQRYSDKNLNDPFAKLTSASIGQQMENDGNLSPQNSTKSTSSQASVFSQKTIKTKGALKGYDNFKVSIPMSGIHIAKESKLDTLVDVALCGDIPKEFDLKENDEEKECVSSEVSEIVTTNSQRGRSTPKSDTSTKNGLQSRARRASTKKELQGNKLGFRAKKKKGSVIPNKPTGSTRPSTTTKEKKRTAALSNQTPPKGSKHDPEDIYAFQDSPTDEADLLTSYSSKKIVTSSSPAITSKSTVEIPSADQCEDSQLSSLSFSDRDDFVYGTNTLSEEDEDDKSSSYSSTQTTPKKTVKADVQKKSLIMGRIFKKTKDKPKEETASKKLPASANDEQAKPVPKDFDKLFDTLKKSESEENPVHENSSNEAEKPVQALDPDLSETYEEDELGDRKLRRRSTQKKLTETWDSDEFEDFNLKNVVDLIEKKDSKISGKRTAVTASEKELPRKEEKSDESPLKVMNQSVKEPILSKGKTASDKKPVVTDETIRQVMESVIMEVSMNKSSRARDNKRRGKTKTSSKAASSDSSKEDENVPEKIAIKDTNSEHNSSLEEHVLESSVMISSKTITTKFKQKLNSTQAGKQKEETKQPQPSSKPQEETKNLTMSNKSVNNNNNQNQKTKVVAKAKEQRKETPEIKTTAQNSKLKQRKGPPKKMKNVAYDPDSDFEDNIKCKKVKKKLLESDIEANLKIEQLNAQLSDSILMPAPRRKRNAAETLYFWSSSSEEDDLEEDYVEVSSAASSKKKKSGTAKPKPTKGQQAKAQQKQKQQQQQNSHQKEQQQQQQQQQQKQLDSQSAIEAGDDTSSSSEHMQQHGWIVGDSHKKLVTLLAHAKGKQDNRPVKATGNRRKT